jgi:uncharacterized protein YjbI with pentapeptide repeats
MARLSYEDSCRALQGRQIIDSGEIPPLPQQPPRYDDDVLGVRFFRTLLAESNIEELTLPRTFFGRSEIRTTSFRNTDLSESTANWNDFIDVDFSVADISRSDFRGCIFERVRFSGARLAGVDFRHCSFTDCDFTNADVAGAKFTRQAGASLQLSSEQRRAIHWQTSDGDEPEGG